MTFPQDFSRTARADMMPAICPVGQDFQQGEYDLNIIRSESILVVFPYAFAPVREFAKGQGAVLFQVGVSVQVFDNQCLDEGE